MIRITTTPTIDFLENQQASGYATVPIKRTFIVIC